MAVFRPFRAYRPKPEHAAEVAAKPYDVLNSDEARVEVKGHPLSFLHVGKPEVDLDPSIDIHDAVVYEQGKKNLWKLINDNILVQDAKPCVYLYAQTMGGHTQYGLVGCASVEEYWNDTIKKHEFTRKDKEEDRSNHVRVTNAHSGPVFLTYPDNPGIDAIVDQVRTSPPVTDHVAPDGIRHQTWVIDNQVTIDHLQEFFSAIPHLYIADGHHRSAAGAIVGRERAKANPKHEGDEEYNFFLAVYFPAGQLRIMDYNRVLKDLNGMNKAQLFEKLSQHFTLTKADTQVRPSEKGQFGLYIEGEWFTMQTDPKIVDESDPVARLDVAILQNYVLNPIFGIADPRTDNRIDFVGGIRGLGELERRVDSGEMVAAFSLHPTSIHELMAIADAGKVMPPKSTWFEPKLRDGLFVHFLD